MNPISPHTLYAVVVWYNPTAEQASAMRGYMEHVKQVIVIDNSTTDNRALLQAHSENTCYISNEQNLGIAAALNIGFRIAIDQGAEWVLTMDQDSRFDKLSFPRFMDLCNQYKSFNEVAIFSPRQVYGEEPNSNLPQYEQRSTVMTSGNLVRATAYQQVGGFREDFFIDLVDDEFCCKLSRTGYLIIMVNDCHLQHQLGNGYAKNRLFRKKFIEHSALRHYYIVRNMLEIMKTYPEFRPYYRQQFWKRIKRLVLYDNHHKKEKLLLSWRGFQSYRKKQMGRYEDIYCK